MSSLYVFPQVYRMKIRNRIIISIIFSFVALIVIGFTVLEALEINYIRKHGETVVATIDSAYVHNEGGDWEENICRISFNDRDNNAFSVTTVTHNLYKAGQKLSIGYLRKDPLDIMLLDEGEVKPIYYSCYFCCFLLIIIIVWNVIYFRRKK